MQQTLLQEFSTLAKQSVMAAQVQMRTAPHVERMKILNSLKAELTILKQTYETMGLKIPETLNQ